MDSATSAPYTGRNFFEVGGFNPHITGPGDIDLLRQIAYQFDVAEMGKIVTFIVLDKSSSTTDYDSRPAQSRWAREKILDYPGVFGRMRESADSSFWYGRIARLYATSMVWDLVQRPLWKRLFCPGGSISGRICIKPDTRISVKHGFDETCFAP